jgi:hypothetical protein
MNLKVKRNFLHAIKTAKGHCGQAMKISRNTLFVFAGKKKEDSRLFYWQSETTTQAADRPLAQLCCKFALENTSGFSSSARKRKVGSGWKSSLRRGEPSANSSDATCPSVVENAK